MSWVKLIAINVMLLLFLLTLIELTGRIADTVKTCVSHNCDFKKVTQFAIRDVVGFMEGNLGLSIRNSELGYLPSPGFSQTINARGWKNKIVTIDDLGFRSNDNNIEGRKSVLTIGDSFTFGDQVSNTETWPACVERHLNVGVANAGVFGYGAAQSVKRAQIETQDKTFDRVIWSVLLTDFQRDKLIYRSGFPRPAVIKKDGIVQWAEVPATDADGSKFGKHKVSTLSAVVDFSYRYSYVLGGLFSLSPKIKQHLNSGSRLNMGHPDAAMLEEIVEFSVSKFASLPVDQKLLVIQYAASDFGKDRIAKLRQRVVDAAIRYRLPVIDTYEELRHLTKIHGDEKIWQGHHTAFGNDAVCSMIVESIE